MALWINFSALIQLWRKVPAFKVFSHWGSKQDNLTLKKKETQNLIGQCHYDLDLLLDLETKGNS